MICIVTFENLYWDTSSSDPQALSRYVSTWFIACHSLCTPVSPHDTLESILEPLDRLLLVDTVASTNLALGSSSLGYSLAGSCPVEKAISLSSKVCKSSNTSSQRKDLHAAVKVHAVDTDCRVILDAQIDMLADTESEVA